VALLPGRAAAGSGRQTVTLCVLTGGRDPLLLGQTTVTVQCVPPWLLSPRRAPTPRGLTRLLCLSPSALALTSAPTERTRPTRSPFTTGAPAAASVCALARHVAVVPVRLP